MGDNLMALFKFLAAYLRSRFGYWAFPNPKKFE